jgi:hypothetical protein
LKRQREALGAVNLRAEEDARTVDAEYDALASEKVDLEEAVKKLRAGIAGLNKEGRERLLDRLRAGERQLLGALFTHLFGGGEGAAGAGGIGRSAGGGAGDSSASRRASGWRRCRSYPAASRR